MSCECKIYYEHEVEELKKTEYERGLNDAWYAAKKIVLPANCLGFTFEELNKIFGVRIYDMIFNNFTPGEAVKKIKEYDAEKEKIHVGDVVQHINDAEIKLLVTAVDSSGCFDGFRISTPNYMAAYAVNFPERKYWKKTGQHFDIQNMFLPESR